MVFFVTVTVIFLSPISRFVTHFSFCHPFLVLSPISRFPSTEHSWNVLGVQGGANPSAGAPGARVGTVYGAKRVIECEMGA
jgi:hypothetical protein